MQQQMPIELSAERRTPRGLSADVPPHSHGLHQEAPIRKPETKPTTTPSVMLNGYSPNTSAKIHGRPARKLTATPVRPDLSVKNLPQLNGSAVDRSVEMAANAVKKKDSDVSAAKTLPEKTRGVLGKRGPRKLAVGGNNVNGVARQLNAMDVVKDEGTSEASVSEVGRRKKAPMKIRKGVGVGYERAG